MSKVPRNDVTIYAPFAGALYAGEPSGGAEHQTRELARELAIHGRRVAHIVFDYEAMEPPDGVELIRQPRQGYNRSWVLYAPRIWAALKKADAAIYIQRMASFETGLVAAFARTHGRRFVFSSASSIDVERRPPLPSRASKLAFRAGRRFAHELVVQTGDQERLVARDLRRRCRVIRSFCALPEETPRRREAFLWIGGLIDYKDPLAYIALAQALPEAHFWMVAHSRGDKWRHLKERVSAAARLLPNLELLPHRSQANLLPLYSRAAAVVNTSTFEGFPNTFVEAWARGTPVISLRVDPDAIIQRERLGFAAGGSTQRLERAAREVWANRDDMLADAQRARSYVARAHSPAIIGLEWLQALDDIARV